jgi:hypothetical protein
MASERNRVLIREYGGKVLAFRDLPIPAQLAAAHYMAIDGEAWQFPEEAGSWPVATLKKKLPELLPYFRKTYGGKRFGYVVIPMEALKESVLRDPYLVEVAGAFDSYEAYDKWLHAQPGFRATRHSATNRWPVVLSSENDETLQDGWHRLHAYYHQGARAVPAIFYP